MSRIHTYTHTPIHTHTYTRVPVYVASGGAILRPFERIPTKYSETRSVPKQLTT